MSDITREEAFELLRKYNQDPVPSAACTDSGGRDEMVCKGTWVCSGGNPLGNRGAAP